MNILHLKYAVEIAKTGSLNKAAENLYMGQPNLSRAIRELEGSLGITIFERTPRGMRTTPDGEEFLQYAVRILAQIDEMEAVLRDGKQRRQTFSLSAPRADYMASAMVACAREAPAEAFTYSYKETNALRTIRNVLSSEYNLGIIRYAKGYDGYFKVLLDEKGLVGEPIAEFESVLLMSKQHPLADAAVITRADLRTFVEVAHPDPFVPSLPAASVTAGSIWAASDVRALHIRTLRRICFRTRPCTATSAACCVTSAMTLSRSVTARPAASCAIRRSICRSTRKTY